jgi:RNA polymerase sigma factor (sigma-70 family)
MEQSFEHQNKTIFSQHDATQFARLFCGGHPHALAEARRQLAPAIHRYIMANKGVQQDVEDLYQEALCLLWLKLKSDAEKFNSRDEVFRYGFAAARNLWLKELRKRKKFGPIVSVEQIASETDSPNEDAAFWEELTAKEKQLAELEKGIAQLGQQCQKILSLFYAEKKSLLHISSLLHMTEASLRNAKYRCMLRLKSFINL